MSEKRVVKVEKQVTESWEVWWANGAACFVPTGQGVYRTYRGEEEKLAGTHPDVQSAVRQCWEENRPLGEDEYRDNHGRVGRVVVVERSRVFLKSGAINQPYWEALYAGLLPRIKEIHARMYTLQPSEYRDPETGLIKDLAEDECRDSQGRVCKMFQRGQVLEVKDHEEDLPWGFTKDYLQRSWESLRERTKASLPRDQYETRILPFLKKHLGERQESTVIAVTESVVVELSFGPVVCVSPLGGFKQGDRVRVTVEKIP